jgi:hypothetical protein
MISVIFDFEPKLPNLLETGVWLLDTYEFIGKPEAHDEILGPFQCEFLRIAANGALRSALKFREMAGKLGNVSELKDRDGCTENTF